MMQSSSFPLIAKFTLWLVTLTTITAQASMAPAPWNDPAFVQRFRASYAHTSDSMPRYANLEEQRFANQLQDLIASNPTEAARRLRAFIKPSSSAPLLYILGNLEYETGNMTSAEASYQSAIKQHPGFHQARENLARVYLSQSPPNYRKGIEALSKVVTSGHANADVYGMMGYALLQQESLIEAETAYRQASLLAHNNKNWKLGLAETLSRQDKLREAIAVLASILKTSPSDASLLMHQGNLYLMNDERQKAAANFELVRVANPTEYRILAPLARIYLGNHSPDAAFALLSEAIDRINPESAPRILDGIESFFRLGEIEECNSLVEKLTDQSNVRLKPSDAHQLRRIRIQLELNTEPTEMAIEAAKELLSQNPLDGTISLAVARAFHTLKQNLEAEIYYEQAATTEETKLKALLEHATLRVSMNDPARAAKLLETAYQLHPKEHLREYLTQVKRLASLSQN